MDDKSVENRIVEQLNAIEVPPLDQQIQAGVMLAGREIKQANVRKWRPVWMMASIIAVISLFLVTVRLSPVVANSVAKIPILSNFVSMIVGEAEATGDQGLLDIVEHEYYQVVQSTQIIKDIKVALHGVIGDETGVVIYYQFYAPFDINTINVKDIHLLDQNKKEIKASSGTSRSYEDENVSESQTTFYTLDAPFEGVGTYYLELVLATSYPNEEFTFTLPFSFDQPIAKTKRIDVGELLRFNGQTVWLDWIELSPLRTSMHIRADEHNTMRILTINEIEIRDESGQHISKVTNGVSSFGVLRDGESTLLLQAHYFDQFETLYIKFDGVEMVPKGDEYIIIDFDQQKVIYQPDYVTHEVTVNGESLSYSELDNYGHIKSFIGFGKDANGQDVYERMGSSSSIDGVYKHTMSYDLSDKVNPITFPIAASEHRLSSPVEIEINIPD